jgi:transposase
MAEDHVRFQSFVGVDLHKCTVSLSAADPSGKVIAPGGRLTISTKCRVAIADWLAKLPGPMHLAVEACPFVEWFIDTYRPLVLELGGRFDIADATALAGMRGKRRKTDRKDADDIAVRLARGGCPLGWIADDAVANLRKLGRQWHRLSRLLGRTKHTMRSILLAANLPGPAVLTGAAAQRWLLARGHLLKGADEHSFGELLDIVALIERQRAPLKRRIELACADERFVPAIRRLQTVRGIGSIWSCLILAEVGDFARFPNADALQFWAGLTPDLKESAGRTVSGPITKAGSRTLRWAIGKAAVTLCRSDADMEAKRQRLIQRTGSKAKANVAMALHLLGVLHAMFRHDADYRPGPAIDRTQHANAARAKRKRSDARAKRNDAPVARPASTEPSTHTRSHATV